MAAITPSREDAGQRQCEPPDDGLREFLIVVRRALLLVIDFIERRYSLKRHS